jgi:hypothetical protein
MSVWFTFKYQGMDWAPDEPRLRFVVLEDSRTAF